MILSYQSNKDIDFLVVLVYYVLIKDIAMSSKLLKLIAISSILASLVLAGLLGYFVHQRDVLLQTPISKTVDGNSMCFLGFCDGSTVSFLPTQSCSVGDICLFRCMTAKCLHPGVDIFKVVKEKTDSGYFFAGDPNDFLCPDGKTCVSVDSRTYGFINEPDILIVGSLSFQ
jgi:hypothetical protein